MRIAYVSESPDFFDEEDISIYQRVKQRRGVSGPIKLDLALLHSPPVADGW